MTCCTQSCWLGDSAPAAGEHETRCPLQVQLLHAGAGHVQAAASVSRQTSGCSLKSVVDRIVKGTHGMKHLTCAYGTGGSPTGQHCDLCAWRSFLIPYYCAAGFALVGGPARQDAPRAIDALKKLNVPYMVSLPLVFQTTEEWLASELGVHPVQVALQARDLSISLNPSLSPKQLRASGLTCAVTFKPSLPAVQQSQPAHHPVQVALQVRT